MSSQISYKDNKKLLDCITNLEPRFKIYSVK